MKKALIFKTHSMKDLMRSIKLGVWVKRKGGGLKEGNPGDVVVFQFEKDYYVGGVYVKHNPELTITPQETNSDWESKDNTDGQYEFIPFRDLTVIPKDEFEINFPNSKTEGANKPQSIGFNHYVSLEDGKLEKLLERSK